MRDSVSANPYFCLKLGKHDTTLTSFVADVSELMTFSFVRICQIDNLEDTENIAMIPLYLRDMAEKREGAKNTPLSVAG